MINLFNSTSFEKLNNLIGWFVFFIALLTYTLTLEPTTSFWDCGEYIATAQKIQVGHPPGAPLFVIIANFFANLSFGNTTNVAWMINFMSALCSAFTILFLFWTITILTKKIIPETSSFSKFSIIFSGFIGSLIYTFSDSFWFSAVEGEVYAMSSLFTAAVFWSILKWEEEFDKPNANRWLVFIAFLIGLSVGVHMLNLLAIPAITSIYCYKIWKKETVDFYNQIVKFITINITGVSILALIYYILVPQTVNLFGKTELYFVNELELSFNSGTLAFLFLLIFGIISGLIISHKKNLIGLNTVILSFMFFLIGYSSFLVLIIRSNANTPIDENSPEDAVSLLAYLNREQYGSHPLIHGHYFNSSIEKSIDGNPVYVKGFELKNWNQSFGEFSTLKKAQSEKEKLENNKNIKNLEIKQKYIISDDRKATIPVYKNNETGFFPRMWSKESLHVNGRQGNNGYLGWSGKQSKKGIPSFSENMKFFWNYQVKHMYVRYFMWNFSGKQNDIQGHGDIFEGNWITGINLIDNYLLKLGPQKKIPYKNAGRNTYFLLPFLLGLFGMIFHLVKKKEDFWAIFLLFFFTGIAIIIELNQTPYQPRERDYAYVGSFFAFSIWTGIGTFGILQFIKVRILHTINKKFQKIYLKNITIGTSIFLLGIPTMMGYQNWDDHDRSKRYTARDFAMNYLDSCKPNAILFTMGDNDTFPLWYVQEVENYRTDVRIVNLSLLNTDWYIDQMKKDAYDGKAVPFSMDRDLYKQGTRDIAYFYPYSQLIADEKIIMQSESFHLGTGEQTEEIKSFVAQKLAMLSKSSRNTALNFLGTRLNISVNETTNVTYLDSINATEQFFYLKDFNEWIKNDQNHTKLNLDGGKYVFSPIQKIKIPVNTDNVLKNNIITKNEKHLIEENLFIDFSNRQGLDKKSLMILDMIEKNNWERPIYFAITIGDPNQNPEPFLFLSDYLQLDGMAYQVVPIKNTTTNSGRIYSKILYNNIMTKFKWGGLDDSNNIYLDETNKRMIRNFKNIFVRLTEQLIIEGDLEKAASVIEKSITIMRPELIDLEIYDLPFIENYLSVLISNLKTEKLNYQNLIDLTNSLIEKYNSEIIYYNSFKNITIQKNWNLQQRILLATQSIKALYSLKQKIPTSEKEKNISNKLLKEKTNDITIKYFNQTSSIIKDLISLNFDNEITNLYEVLVVYFDIANINDHPELLKMELELKTIHGLVQPAKSQNVFSAQEVCSCIERSQEIDSESHPCVSILTSLMENYFQKNQENLDPIDELCPGYINAFIQQLEAARNL